MRRLGVYRREIVSRRAVSDDRIHMSYEVIARKWRPQQFEDVVGQDHVTGTLRNAIASGRVAHAYLFVGPRGIGKTSVARIFAKALNCAKGPTGKPCDACDSCREITSGSSLDVIEIDGASNNGVDNVRDLRDTVQYMPGKGKYRIYIIDEVHMLSVAAFNALLKTLEEPPSHVVFLFATTEPEKVLATIISRCQRFDLKRIPLARIVERLRLIAKSEKVEIDEAALLAVARGAEGGLRDAESALDQLISFRGNRIAEEDVLSVFGLVAKGTLEQLAERILTGDMAELLGDIGRLDESGKDLPRTVAELIEHYRNLLISLCAESALASADLTDSQRAVLERHRSLTDAEKVLRVLDILMDTQERMKFALSKRTVLEVGLIKCARAGQVASLEELLKGINALRAADRSGAEESPASDAVRKPTSSASAVRESAAAPVARLAVDELGLLKQRWSDIVARVGRMAVLAKAPLMDAHPVSVIGDKVVVAMDPEFGKELAEFDSSRNRNRMSLERVLSDVLGRTVSVSLRIGDDVGEAETEAVPSPVAAVVAPVAEPADPSRPRQIHEWLKEPAVQKTLSMFEGTIAEVRE
jgi:DNA polymerase-3 subunit gamma/tau